MPSYLGISQPYADEPMATTFYVCGGYQGLTSITVQIMEYDSTKGDMTQVGNDIAATLSGGSPGTFSTAAITLNANGAGSPDYLVLASGDGASGAVAVATAVRFTCVSSGGNGNACSNAAGKSQKALEKEIARRAARKKKVAALRKAAGGKKKAAKPRGRK